VLLDEVLAQLDLWREQQPVTLRQLFYGLVGRGVIDKDERSYARLGELLVTARRASVVPFEAIRDDGSTFEVPYGYHGTADFLARVRAAARQYRRHRQAGQGRYVELWCEAAGMAPQLRRVADRYGVPVASSGGFDSLTAKYDAARRFAGREVPTVVLHVGDHDPSGCAIIDSAAEDITAFCDGGTVEFRRLAVTPELITELSLPTAPAKARDRRGEHMAATVQAEAIPPGVLAGIVVDGIKDVLDLGVYEQVLRFELADQAELVGLVEGVEL
jgi:hypothetical protein